MASKFQNRLVGTIIIVALGVIVLPGVLDGQKKHYQEEFAAIPLVPKPEDQQETDMVPPVTQSLPAQPPEASGAVPAETQNTSQADSGSTVPTSRNQPTVVSPPPVQQQQQQQQVQQQVKPPKVVEKTKPQAVEKPVEKPKAAEKPKPQVKPEAKVETPVESAAPAAETAPSGQAFVVQLGALKNAARVNEIVAQLRLSGYRAFTVPATPVAGQITRIYVGPDASKAKMQAAVGPLQGISGLSGVVKPYGVR